MNRETKNQKVRHKCRKKNRRVTLNGLTQGSYVIGVTMQTIYGGDTILTLTGGSVTDWNNAVFRLNIGNKINLMWKMTTETLP